MNGRMLIIAIASALTMKTGAQTLAPSSSDGRCRGVNVLTPAERGAGWRLLFDGTGTAGWHGYNRQSLESWTIDDCALFDDPALPSRKGAPAL